MSLKQANLAFWVQDHKDITEELDEESIQHEEMMAQLQACRHTSTHE